MLEHSGATSHAVILARSLGIPTLVGVKNARALLMAGQEVVVDAIRGFVVTQVSPAVQKFLRAGTENARASTRISSRPNHGTSHYGRREDSGSSRQRFLL